VVYFDIIAAIIYASRVTTGISWLGLYID